MKSGPWTAEEVAILREEWDTRGFIKRTARRLDCSCDRVRVKAKHLADQDARDARREAARHRVKTMVMGSGAE